MKAANVFFNYTRNILREFVFYFWTHLAYLSNAIESPKCASQAINLVDGARVSIVFCLCEDIAIHYIIPDHYVIAHSAAQSLIWLMCKAFFSIFHRIARCTTRAHFDRAAAAFRRVWRPRRRRRLNQTRSVQMNLLDVQHSIITVRRARRVKYRTNWLISLYI